MSAVLPPLPPPTDDKTSPSFLHLHHHQQGNVDLNLKTLQGCFVKWRLHPLVVPYFVRFRIPQCTPTRSMKSYFVDRHFFPVKNPLNHPSRHSKNRLHKSRLHLQPDPPTEDTSYLKSVPIIYMNHSFFLKPPIRHL